MSYWIWSYHNLNEELYVGHAVMICGIGVMRKQIQIYNIECGVIIRCKCWIRSCDIRCWVQNLKMVNVEFYDVGCEVLKWWI